MSYEIIGHFVQTNRLIEGCLIFIMVFGGYGAAFAFAWGLIGGKRVKPLWLAASSAGPVILLWAANVLVSGWIWVPW